MSVTIDKTQGKRLLKNFTPPEGVPIQLEIASLGARFGAQTLDILITFGSAILLLILLAYIDVMNGPAMFVFFILFIFFLRIPYYVFSELIWNGRTLGKRIVKIRVISADGRSLTPYQIAARNLLKEVEVFLPITLLFMADTMYWPVLVGMGFWMLGVLLVPVFNRRKQRLGDMIAGTLVITQPVAVLMPDLSEGQGVDETRFTFGPEHLGIYGRYELQTLETILRDPPKSKEAIERVSEVVRTIRHKIGYPVVVKPEQEWDFLLEFYRSEREFLESRHLFGDSRENKFHDQNSDK